MKYSSQELNRGAFPTNWSYLVKRVDLYGNTKNELDYFKILLVLLGSALHWDLFLTEISYNLEPSHTFILLGLST